MNGLARWTSRKFLLALIPQIAALLVLFLPDHEQAIRDWADRLTAVLPEVFALLALGISAWAFNSSEGKIDAARVLRTGTERDTGMRSPQTPDTVIITPPTGSNP